VRRRHESELRELPALIQSLGLLLMSIDERLAEVVNLLEEDR
jgi:hypothetical protein